MEKQTKTIANQGRILVDSIVNQKERQVGLINKNSILSLKEKENKILINLQKERLNEKWNTRINQWNKF